MCCVAQLLAAFNGNRKLKWQWPSLNKKCTMPHSKNECMNECVNSIVPYTIHIQGK